MWPVVGDGGGGSVGVGDSDSDSVSVLLVVIFSEAMSLDVAPPHAGLVG
jgi:hypothetical protein